MHNQSGLLNNIKWFKLFDLLETLGLEFSLNIMNPERKIYTTFIRELESDCLIADDKNGFIKFLDIKNLMVSKHALLIHFLEDQNYPFAMDQTSITVYGYR